jgi:hypothetical protein
MGAEGSAQMRAGRLRRRQPPRPRPRRGLRLPAPLAVVAFVAVGLAVGLTGCGHSAANTASGRKLCGTSHTSVNVPVSVEVQHGSVSCATAMTVEKDYADAIDAGKATGNGGAVQVSGWTCHYFPTPEQLKTGDVSKCTKAGAEILAVLTATG